MADIRIRFSTENLPTRDLQRLRGEVARLQREFGQTQESSTRAARGVQQVGQTSQVAARGVDRLGDEAQQAAIGVDTLGRNIFKTSAEAKRFGGIFQDASGRLREANGRYAAANVRIREYTAGIGGATRGTEGLARSFGGATGGAQVFTRSLGGLSGVLGAIGIAAVTHQLTQFGVESVQAAGRLEQYVRATEQITGSAEAAEIRIAELVEIANLPGLNFEALTRFSNRLIAAGVSAEDTDKILLTTGQTIVSLGGTAATAELAIEQLIQAFQQGTVDMRDFRTIIQQIPGFLEAAGDVHGVESSIAGLRQAFDNVGGSMRDLVIPVFDELSRRFEAPPADSYIVAMDELQNAFFLTQAAIGDQFLPVVVDTAQGLASFFETLRTGIGDVTTLPEPIQGIVAGAQALYESLRSVGETITGLVGPPVQELLSQLGGLLGAVLELTGALYNGLEPVFQAVYTVVGTVVAAIAQLVDHITLLVGGLADGVNWLTSFWREEDQVVESTNKLAAATEMLSEVQGKLASSGDAQRAKLKELQTELDETTERIARYEERLKAADEAGVSNRSTQQFERLLATARERVTELEAEIEQLTTTYGGATAALGENATEAERNEAKLADLQTQLQSVNDEIANYEDRLTKAREVAVGETNPAIEQLERRLAAAQEQASGLQTEIDVLTGTLAASSGAAAQASENYSLALAKLKAEAEDTRDALSDSVNIQDINSNYQAALQASDAYYDSRINAAQEALAAAKEGSQEEQEIQVELFELLRGKAEAQLSLLERASSRESAIRKRLTDARIDEAARAREVEVKGFEDAAKAGTSYAAQLRALRSVSQRQHFVDLVDSLQAQGLSLDEARAKASEFFESLNTIPPVLTGIDAAYGEFSHTFQTESELSAQAVGNLVGRVLQLGDALGDISTDTLDRLDSSLERDLLNEQRYFANLPSGGITIESDQQRAYQEGLAFIDRLFARQDREAEIAVREASQEFHELVSTTGAVIGEFSRLDGSIGELGTKIGQFDIAGLASGNPVSIATLPFQLYDAFTFDQRQADATRPARERENFERFYQGEFGIPVDTLASAREGVSRAIEALSGSLTLTDEQIEQLTFHLEGLSPQIGRTSLLDIDELPDDIVETISQFTAGIVDELRENFDQASHNLQNATELDGEAAFQDFITATTEYYQAQLDFIALVRRATGNLSFGDPEAVSRQLENTLNQARAEQASEVSRVRRPGYVFDATRGGFVPQATVFTEDASEGSGLGAPAASAEADAATLAEIIEGINEDVALINASITSIETQIDQASDPEEIAELLNQLPELIRQKYQRLRDALTEQYYADEISQDVYSASISELNSSESAELERQSDAALANTLRAISEDVGLIDASIASLQTQIDQANDPEAIAALLAQLPALITNKYQNLREALDEKYAAGEISVDVYNASLTELATSESAERERHSDAVLANTLSEIDADVALIDAEIGALQLAVEQSDDPEIVVGILNAIKILIADKYKRLRERLEELHAAEEISDTAFNAASLALGTAESQALAGIDTQAINEIAAEARDRANFINGAIENLRTSLELTDDPTEIQAILDAIKTLTSARFQALRDELEAVRDTLSPEEYTQALEGLNLGEQLALENIDTEKFEQISAVTAEQVGFINGQIENLRLAIQLTDDPAEQQQILNAIKVLVMARFDVLHDELEKIRETLSDAEYEQALTGLNLGEQLSLQNLDTEKFGVISAEAQRQVGLINGAIENLRLAFELADDPTESQQILDAIKILTAKRFDVLIQELKAIETSLSPEEFEQTLQGLELGKQVALENVDAEKLDLISAESQKQVNLINGTIENLRLSLELTDDPTEIQQILTAIETLTRSRFAVLRKELEAVRDTLSPEEFQQALTGLNLGEQLTLQNINTERFDAISAEAQKQVGLINGAIENLRLSLELTDDLTEQQEILTAIKVLTQGRFAILRKELADIKDTLDTDEYEQALEGLNLGEQLSLQNLDTEKFSAISAAAQEQIGLINGSIENLRLSLQLTDDLTETQQILDAIKILTASRFDVLIQELKDIQENLSPEEYEQALKGLELGKQLALEAIDTEKFDAISDAAQEQANFINGTIENLRLSLELTDNPTEQQQIIESIKVLTRARFQILRDELADIRENLSPEEYQQTLTGLNLGEQLAIQNLDTEKFGIISESAQKQVDFINRSIENLRLSLELADDPTEIQQILDAIKVLTRGRFAILRQELADIRENLSPADYQQALTGLNLGEQVALKNLDAEKFSAISAEAQKQVQFIEGAIENLRLSLELTVDPAEIQQILDAIQILTGARFDVLIEELNAIKDTLDPAQFNQALTGLQLGKEVALRGLDNEALGVTISQINTDTQAIDTQISAFNSQIENSDDPAEIRTLLLDLQEAIMEKYRLQKEVLQRQLDAEEISIASFNAQLGTINIQEGQALGQAETFAFGQLNDIRSTENALLRNAIERSQFNLDRATSESEFETRQQELLTLTNQYYDAELTRINELQLLELELQDLREDNQLARVQALQRVLDLTYDIGEAERIRERAETSRADIQRQTDLSLEDRDIAFRRDVEDLLQGVAIDGFDTDDLINDLLTTSRENRSVQNILQEVLSSTGDGFDRPIRENLEGLLRQLGRDREDIALQESRDLEDVALQEERALAQLQQETQRTLVDSNVTLTDAILGLTDAVTGTTPEELTTPSGTEQVQSPTQTPLSPTPSPAAVDPVTDVSQPDFTALTDFGVATRQFSQDAVQLRKGVDHLLYIAEEVPNFAEILSRLPPALDALDTAADAAASGISGAAAEIVAAVNQIQSDIGAGGISQSGQPIRIQFPINDRVVQEITVRQEQLHSQDRLVRRV